MKTIWVSGIKESKRIDQVNVLSDAKVNKFKAIQYSINMI